MSQSPFKEPAWWNSAREVLARVSGLDQEAVVEKARVLSEGVGLEMCACRICFGISRHGGDVMIEKGNCGCGCVAHGDGVASIDFPTRGGLSTGRQLSG